MEKVNALSIILARSLCAGANVVLAPKSSPSRQTSALKFTNVVSAGCTVQARLSGTVVNVDLAESTREALSALASEFVVLINAHLCSLRVAWVAQALVNLQFTLKT